MRYIFEQRCKPNGKPRIRETLEFLKIMMEGLGFSKLRDAEDRDVILEEQALATAFENEIRGQQFPGNGAELHFFGTMNDKRVVRFEIRTGIAEKERFAEYFNVAFDSGMLPPPRQYLERSIQAVKPFEAFVSEEDNEERWDSYDRQTAIKDFFSQPAMIRWFHYLSGDFTQKLGGLDHCLKAPAWSVQKFETGAIIQLTEKPLDSGSDEDFNVQRSVMQHFHILDFATR